MKFIARVANAVIANTFALLASGEIIPGVILSHEFIRIFGVAAILTAINFLAKPLLKLLLTPVIIVTFGAGLLLVNALILFFLDFLSEDIMMQGALPLLFTTLMVSAVNVIGHFATKS